MEHPYSTSLIAQKGKEKKKSKKDLTPEELEKQKKIKKATKEFKKNSGDGHLDHEKIAKKREKEAQKEQKERAKKEEELKLYAKAAQGEALNGKEKKDSVDLQIKDIRKHISFGKFEFKTFVFDGKRIIESEDASIY